MEKKMVVMMECNLVSHLDSLMVVMMVSLWVVQMDCNLVSHLDSLMVVMMVSLWVV